MQTAGTAGWVRSLRGPRRAVDPFAPLAHLWEEEREPGGAVIARA